MATAPVIPAEEITKKEFNRLLNQYPSLLETISASKGAKPGQRTLKQLDAFRYEEALGLFDIKNPQRRMGLEDLKTLLEWKLRHGKFRPGLMAMVSNSEDGYVQDLVNDALKIYAEKDASAGVSCLSAMKGIGPATASLVLAVHDAANIIFFSDEAFYWLCCNGQKGPIKYQLKEYEALLLKARALIKRLGVSATDIERVAYVLFKQPGHTESKEKVGTKKKVESKEKDEPKVKPKAKRKKAKVEPEQEPIDGGSSEKTSLRRSKRIRAS